MKKRNSKMPVMPKSETINSYPRELRGFSQNKWGGHNSQRMRGYKPQGVFGGKNRCIPLTAEQIKEIEEDLRRRGIVS